MPVLVLWFEVMPSRWRTGRGGVLDGWKVLGEQAARRTAEKRDELPGEVGLVGVAAPGGDVGQTLGPGGQEQAPGPLQADHPARRLGRESELVDEPAAQVLAGPADLVGHPGHG